MKTKAIIILFIAISMFSCNKDNGTKKQGNNILTQYTWIKYNYIFVYSGNKTFGPYRDTTSYDFDEKNTLKCTGQILQISDSIANNPLSGKKVKFINSTFSTTYSINKSNDTISIPINSNQSSSVLDRWRNPNSLPIGLDPSYLKYHIIKLTQDSLIMSSNIFPIERFKSNKK